MKPRSHKYSNQCKPYKMADGGKVKDKPKPKPKPDPDMLGSGAARNAGDILKNKRKQQMKDLGL